MPNWCQNTLTITGNTETLVELKTVIESDEDGLLQAIRPMPEELKGTVSPSEGENWRSWALENWGCKWDVSTEGLEYIDNGDGTSTISGWFDSAWAPPLEAFDSLASDWDSCYIELKYYEGGMCFIGVWDSEGGDAYYEDIEECVRRGDHKEDSVMAELVEDFGIEESIEMWDEEEKEGYC